MNTKSAVAVLASCCLLAACVVNQDVGSQYAKQQTVQALQGGTVTVTHQDDPWLEGTAIQIPPSALKATTNITIAEGKDLTAVPTGAIAVSHAAIFGPSGTDFTHPTTVTLALADSTHDVSGLSVVGVADDGTTLTVSGKDLLINSTSRVVSFTTRKLIHYQLIWTPPSTGKCGPNETFCGCCDNGSCIPAGQACPLLCPAIACVVDAGTGGGTGGGSGGGGSCCPAGEYFCGCGNVGQCIPADQACPLACPVQGDPTTGGTVPPPPPPTCCGPGTYLCGCGGQGQCIPDDQACPIACPVCDPTTTPTPCGCLPPGAACGCDPNQPSTVPCQCDPTTAVSNDGNTGGPAIICSVDGGPVCPAGEYLSPCGCIPEGAICAPPPQDGGVVCGTATGAPTCCDGQCPGPNGVCPQVCFADGGTGSVDGGVCPFGTARCSPGGPCQPSGLSCPAPDAGSSTGGACPSGEIRCKPTDPCQPSGQPCGP